MFYHALEVVVRLVIIPAFCDGSYLNIKNVKLKNFYHVRNFI